MSDKQLVEQCSPTLAGLKTGNLFRCSFRSREGLNSEIRQLNRQLGRKGIRVVVLSVGESSALIYLYRPDHLQRDMDDPTARRLLQERGYPVDDLGRCVVHLQHRISKCEEFPHEIGLFLGYPPKDVQGFLEKGPHRCKCTGCWKVYGDVASARSTFSRYKKYTAAYSRMIEKGKTIEQLTVAV